MDTEILTMAERRLQAGMVSRTLPTARPELELAPAPRQGMWMLETPVPFPLALVLAQA